MIQVNIAHLRTIAAIRLASIAQGFPTLGLYPVISSLSTGPDWGVCQHVQWSVAVNLV